MKAIVSIFMLLVCFAGYSQDDDEIYSKMDESALSYRSFSVTPLGGYFVDVSGGLIFNGDISFGLRKHMFSLGFSMGTEFNIIGSSNSFEQVNLFYGREVSVLRYLVWDVHAGVGYFSYSSTNREQDGLIDGRNTTIGFPIMTKFRFLTGERFSLGLQLQANLNSVNTVYSIGIVLQWNKKK